jgi:hypothetical protein
MRNYSLARTSRRRAARAPATVTYNLDASQSKFMAHANAGGLFWFKGHSHHLAASEFSGQVELLPTRSRLHRCDSW